MRSNSIRYCLIIVVIVSLNSFAYAKEKHEKKTHQLSIVNATANLDNDILYISGENFGKDPEIWLDDDILSILFKNDDYIEAVLPDDIEAGTYRLVIDGKKKKPKHHLFPMWKFMAPLDHMDRIDITIGVTGPQGIAGPIGSQGPLGLKGDKGDAGSQGIAGPIGPQGFTGSKGDKGDDGPQGLIGPIGPQGLTGSKGDKGDDGLQGLIGPIGPQGLTGSKGEKGDDGLQGLIGPIGPQGLTGSKGDKGDDGLQGLIGPIGPQGLTGSKGEKGDGGLQGLTGSMGPQGPVGAKGSKGNTGLQGPVGSKGAKGNTGSRGPAGPKGAKGDPGISGYGIVSNSANTTLLSFGGNSYALSVSCPSGKKVLGGGGKSDYNGDLLSESYPTATGNGWTIKYTNQSAYTKKITLTVYAICAECL